jgi:hypothetical protein
MMTIIQNQNLIQQNYETDRNGTRKLKDLKTKKTKKSKNSIIDQTFEIINNCSLRGLNKPILKCLNDDNSTEFSDGSTTTSDKDTLNDDVVHEYLDDQLDNPAEKTNLLEQLLKVKKYKYIKQVFDNTLQWCKKKVTKTSSPSRENNYENEVLSSFRNYSGWLQMCIDSLDRYLGDTYLWHTYNQFSFKS